MPKFPPIYPRKLTAEEEILMWQFLDPNWPPKDECVNHIKSFPQVKDFPSLFMSARNKGFDVSAFLGEKQNLGPEDEHPLPWYPPLCDRILPLDHVDFLDTLNSVKNRDRLPINIPDPSIRTAFLEEAASFKPKEEEIGQRILTALKREIGPSWLLYNLGSLYWRALGDVPNSVECLRRALHTVPEHFSDVVLVNLATLLFKANQLEDAVTTAYQALSISKTEPITHFLLANLNALKGNLTGAIQHYRRTLQLEPSNTSVLRFYQIVKCYHRRNVKILKNEGEIFSKAHNEMCRPKPSLDSPSQSWSCYEDQLTSYNLFVEDVNSDLEEYKVSSHEMTGSSCKPSEENYKKETRGQETEGRNSPSIRDNQGTDEASSVLEESVTSFDASSSIGQVNLQNLKNKVRLKVSVSGRPEQLNGEGYGSENSRASPSMEDKTNYYEEPQDKSAQMTLSESSIVDDPYPSILVDPTVHPYLTVASVAECARIKKINLKQFTSTWLSVSAKNIHVSQHLVSTTNAIGHNLKPYCDSSFPVSLLTLDHLAGVRQRHLLKFTPETGLREAFLTLGGDFFDTNIDVMATRVALSLTRNSTSWVLTTLAALYWRVTGEANQSVNCLRVALHSAPREMKDIPLISLANILHRVGLLNDALIVANMALEISPDIVVIHFSIANIYAAMDDLARATAFYESTLARQMSFEPARERLRWIQCNAVYEGTIHTSEE
ncbi:tetratricopeptide repeat protein 17-like [Limulus polyphemus]|uniref:Tetratricopeptide repeat protein 17-like n=1 Tax=Limulus polyphemus TaxID=6850 RepID=A0ABM1T2V3_LIMPO|nr:tetratricopeptide repeat protein 17-like [Limulus polyphemus]